MNSSGTYRPALLGACAVAALCLSACTPPPATEVTGTIKLKGKAPDMKGLEISFLAPDGRMASSPIRPDGTYSVANVPVGEAKIAFVFTATNVATSSEPSGRLVKPPAGKRAPTPKEQTKNPIPAPLREASTSNLWIKVEGGQTNTFNYDIRP